jgi:hypothetical protein
MGWDGEGNIKEIWKERTTALNEVSVSDSDREECDGEEVDRSGVCWLIGTHVDR